MQKFIKYFLWIVLVFTLVYAIIFYSQDTSNDALMEPYVNFFLQVGYVLTFLALGVVIILPLINTFQNKKGIKRLGITLLLAVVLCGVAYALGSPAPVEANIEELPSATTLKLTDAGLLLAYLLFIIAIIVIAWGGIRNSISKR